MLLLIECWIIGSVKFLDTNFRKCAKTIWGISRSRQMDNFTKTKLISLDLTNSRFKIVLAFLISASSLHS
jgi:hypothetical protein